MTQVVYYVAASLDGFIAGPQGELDWLHAFEQVGNDYGYSKFFATVDGLVMGRATWEVTRSFGAWPYGDRSAWLLTRRPVDPADLAPALRVAAGPPEALYAQWQAQGLQRVWLVGGGDVAAQFLAAGLVHELMLATMPVTLGRGIGLFGGNTGNTLPHWTVVASQSHANGVLTRHYRQAGPVSASR